MIAAGAVNIQREGIFGNGGAIDAGVDFAQNIADPCFSDAGEILPIDDDDRSERAGAEAVDIFKGEFVIRGCFAGFNFEMIFEFLCYAGCAAHMAGCALANTAQVFAARF